MRGELNALSRSVFLKTVAAIEIEKVSIIKIDYPPEVRRGKYWGLGVFPCNTSLLSIYGNVVS